MKQKLLLFGLTSLLLVLGACASKEERAKDHMKKAVEKVKEELPKDLGNGTTIVDVNYADDLVTIDYTYDERDADIELIGYALESQKESLAKMMKQEFEKDVEDVLKDSGASFLFRIEGLKSKKTIEFKMSNEEIVGN